MQQICHKSAWISPFLCFEKSWKSAWILFENVCTHPDIHWKNLHLKIFFSGNFRTSPRGQWVNAEEKSVHSNSYTKDALATLQHPLQSCDQSQALYIPKTDRGVLVNIGSGYGWLAAGQMPVPVDALVPIFVRLSAVTLMIKYEI